jgi:lactoylglutathione lyase
MSGRSAREVVEQLLRRQQASADMINHAAGLQDRSGLARILSVIDHDLGPVTVEQHHLRGHRLDPVADRWSRCHGISAFA